MALNSMGLGMVFTARDLASSTMSGLERQLRHVGDTAEEQSRRMQTAARSAAAGLGLMTAGGLALGASFKLASEAGKFQQKLDAVGQISGATADEMDRLEESATKAGLATKFSPQEAADGLLSLSAAGQDAHDATRTLIPVLDLATGSLGQLGVQGAAEAVVGTLKSYQMSADEAANVTDRLLKITQLTNFQARDFSAGLSKAAATGAVFEQSLDDVLVTMGLLRNMNIDASVAATSVRAAYAKLGANKRSQEIVRDLGVAIEDSTGKMRPAIEITQDLVKATDHLSRAKQKSVAANVFGRRGLFAFNAIAKAQVEVMRDGEKVTLKGADAINHLRQEVANSAGAASEFREAWQNNFAGQLEIMQGVVQTFVNTVGAAFARVLRPVIEFVSDAVKGLINVWKALPAPVQNVIAGAVVLAGALTVLAGVLFLVRAGILLVRVAITFLASSFAAIAAAAWPILAVLAAVAAAAIAVKLAWEHNFGGFRDFILGVWDKVKLVFRAIVQLFREGGFSGAVRRELAKAENSGIKKFATAVFMIFSKIKSFFLGVLAGLKDGLERVEPAFSFLVDAVGDLWDSIGELLAQFLELIGVSMNGTSTFETIGFVLGEVASVVAGTLAVAFGVLHKILSAVLDVVGWIIEKITDLISLAKDAASAIGDFAGSVVDKLSIIPGIDVGVQDPANIPGGRLSSAEQRELDQLTGADKFFSNAPTPGNFTAPGAAETVADQTAAADAEAARAPFGGMKPATQDDINAYIQATENRPVQVQNTIELDGEVVARSVEERRRSDAGRRFAEVEE